MLHYIKLAEVAEGVRVVRGVSDSAGGEGGLGPAQVWRAGQVEWVGRKKP